MTSSATGDGQRRVVRRVVRLAMHPACRWWARPTVAGMRTAVIILVVGIIALIAALLLVRPSVTAGQTVPRADAQPVDGWEIAWHRASDRALREGRPVLANFTGSDWCPPCMQLHRDIFATPVFRAWAERRVVLFEVDFPQRIPQAAEVAAQNDALQRRYGINGFPSVLLISAQGVELGRIERRPPGGPEDFVAKVESILARSVR